jgi:hypothetical protein
MQAYPADGRKRRDTPCTSKLLVVERDTYGTPCPSIVLYTYTAGGGKGHANTSYSGKGYTLHIHTAGGGKGYTICTSILLVVERGTP